MVNRRLIIVGLAVAAAILAGGIRLWQFHGDAKPGVRVLGIDVGGQSRSEIVSAIDRWSAQRVTIHADGHSYHVPRGWLVAVDAQATATRALAAGTASSLLVARRTDVLPAVKRASVAGNVLSEIARAGRPAVSATVRVDGWRAVTTPARIGRRLDRAALLRRLTERDLVVEAPFAPIKPLVGTAAARAAGAKIDALLAAPVAIDYHGARRGSLTRTQLARALSVQRDGQRFAVTLDGDRLTRIVRPRVGKWIVRAHNAQFVVAGNSVRVTQSRPGHDVDPAQLAAAVMQATGDGHIAHLELGPRAPDRTTAEAKALGIRRKLVSYTTQMGESSSNRIHNVHLMADFIDGTIIEPGEVFSFNDVVGPRTSERGFLEGQMIIGSLVLPSIGGGVCQTATTLFNDAFELGLPILERTNHNLYLAHYPLGRDATVSWGGPDFRFRNDLKHGLLIKASYTDQTLTFTVFGTPEGRRVVSHTGEQVKWTSPGMNYAVDPTAPRGSVKVVKGTGEKGFDIEVWRRVYDRSGKLLRSNVFKSHYIPDSPTTVYGPGRTPAGPYIVLPTTT
ncbi:MAG TPA: VanW family protein [Gaiellaceae bacterium]|nr:VanW family protein [Gaiellaceae bacterium]